MAMSADWQCQQMAMSADGNVSRLAMSADGNVSRLAMSADGNVSRWQCQQMAICQQVFRVHRSRDFLITSILSIKNFNPSVASDFALKLKYKFNTSYL